MAVSHGYNDGIAWLYVPCGPANIMVKDTVEALVFYEYICIPMYDILFWVLSMASIPTAEASWNKYRKVSNIRRVKYQNLNASSPIL